MNFLDTYEVASETTPTQRPEQSLNDEVSEVIGQLGRFWGGFRKQSQSVLETARKDFSQVVSQAQREITKLTSEPAPGSSTSGTERTTSEGGPSTTDRETEGASQASPSQPEQNATQSTSATASTSLFSRLQSALPPNLLETARNQLPESLKHASESVDLPQLRANFISEFQRVQGVTRAQAEEYAHKSEALLREAVKEAGEVLREAVKILPPEESGSAASGLVWDGSDMWSLPLEPSDAASSSNPSTSGSTSQRRLNDAQDAVATRAQSLFRRLKQDPAILRHDPALDGGDLYSAWVATEVTPKEGGIEGEHWSAKIAELLAEPGSGEVLKATRDALVPSELTAAGFWTRFFFRAHQIETEEQKRKALLKGTLEEEDFSWEDEDDETGDTETPMTLASVAGRGSADPLTEERLAQAGDTNGNLSASPSTVARESSEDYDVVSSGNVSPRAEHNPVTPSDEANDDGSDADSDWE
ncbi:putative BSD domain containing protein [Lyophyllum shimeji]|uniref:BSD domain containing protein n=1 Tax=Lyophyllum shimeji TaxID=47721 RepID=A0A9P3UN83_LYOSH|nr:putative BSD domain containing protein [Lyophyllum shimeji]